MTAIGAIWQRGVLHFLRNRAAVIAAMLIPGINLACLYSVFSDTTSLFGVDYITFIFPASVLQVIIFAAGGAALDIAQDQEHGMLTRLRVMGVSPAAIVSGRLLADVTRVLISGSVLSALAVALGAQLPASPWQLGVLVLIFLLLTVIFSAGMCGLCLLSKKPTSVALLIQSLVMSVIFFSTAFFPAEVLSPTIRPIITHMPLSPIVDMVRAVLLDRDPTTALVVEATAWVIVLLVLATVGFGKAFAKETA